GADGNVDLPGEDDERHAHGDDEGRGHCDKGVPELVRSEKPVGLRPDREDDEQAEPGEEHGQFPPVTTHAGTAVRCPRASSRTRSCVASARSSVPTPVPPCITAIRSDRARTSGNSEEIIKIARPLAARSPMRAWISAFAPTSTPCVGSSRMRTL